MVKIGLTSGLLAQPNQAVKQNRHKRTQGSAVTKDWPKLSHCLPFILAAKQSNSRDMKFTRRLPKRPVAPTPEGEIGEAAAAPAVAEAAHPGPAPEIWVIGLIAVIAILLVLFSLVLR